MFIQLLRAKIHRARITDANLQYEGSIGIGTDLLAASTIRVHERVQVVNLNNGVRFETYVIEGKPGEITLNGPAARLGQIGDEVIILAYGLIDPGKGESVAPTIVRVDSQNHPI
ncbi:MAG: aspartate 1-decarboxylase [candidate division Zixibacteria bacterium]|nr:aspartate 1-decarboxylase [candidate division Zixibacteria bacterium]